jgi:cytochrome P450
MLLMENTIMGFINERRASGKDQGDLLSMLLLAIDEENGGQMTNKQVRDEVMTLFIAGHETTANALAWTFYLLAQHPEVENGLVNEITDMLGNRRATTSDLPSMPYASMVMKESMRLYPPAWVVTREAQEDIELRGYSIPKKSLVMLPIYAVHRDPRFWDEPEAFRPERFDTGWEDRVPKYAYLPFGGGPRVCVGNQFAMMEAQLVLITVLQRVRLTLLPGKQVVPQPLVTLRPYLGIQMQISVRETVEKLFDQMPIVFSA